MVKNKKNAMKKMLKIQETGEYGKKEQWREKKIARWKKRWTGRKK